MIPFTHSLFFKELAKLWLGVGLSLHHSQQELSGPHRRSNRYPVAAALWSMVELKGGFLLFEILLSPWMLPPPGFEKKTKKKTTSLCLSLVVQLEEELLKTLDVFCDGFRNVQPVFAYRTFLLINTILLYCSSSVFIFFPPIIQQGGALR